MKAVAPSRPMSRLSRLHVRLRSLSRDIYLLRKSRLTKLRQLAAAPFYCPLSVSFARRVGRLIYGSGGGTMVLTQSARQHTGASGLPTCLGEGRSLCVCVSALRPDVCLANFFAPAGRGRWPELRHRPRLAHSASNRSKPVRLPSNGLCSLN